MCILPGTLSPKKACDTWGQIHVLRAVLRGSAQLGALPPSRADVTPHSKGSVLRAPRGPTALPPGSCSGESGPAAEGVPDPQGPPPSHAARGLQGWDLLLSSHFSYNVLAITQLPATHFSHGLLLT